MEVRYSGEGLFFRLKRKDNPFMPVFFIRKQKISLQFFTGEVIIVSAIFAAKETLQRGVQLKAFGVKLHYAGQKPKFDE